MGNININQEWNFVVTETHGEKANAKNLLKRELLFALEILLSKIGTAKTLRETDFLKHIYVNRMLKKAVSHPKVVIPAKAGIYNLLNLQQLDSR